MAAKWCPAGETCPHCGRTAEDNFHRFWVCPRWDSARFKVLGDVHFPWLRQMLPRIAFTHGLLPIDPELERTARAAEQAGMFPETEQLHGAVSTDGSAVFPRDPLLRRAARPRFGGVRQG